MHCPVHNQSFLFLATNGQLFPLEFIQKEARARVSVIVPLLWETDNDPFRNAPL